jgi:hypothetical protein
MNNGLYANEKARFVLAWQLFSLQLADEIQH